MIRQNETNDYICDSLDIRTTINNDEHDVKIKLEEEVDELLESLVQYIHNPSNRTLTHARDELSDCYIVLAQLARILEYTDLDLQLKLTEVIGRYSK